MARMAIEHPFFPSTLPVGVWGCTFPNGEYRTDVIDPDQGFLGEIKSSDENESASIAALELPQAVMEVFSKLASDGEFGLLVGSVEGGYATIDNVLVCNYLCNESSKTLLKPAVKDALSLFEYVRRDSQRVIGVFKPGSTEVLYDLLTPEMGMGVVVGRELLHTSEGTYMHVSALSSNAHNDLFWVNVVRVD